MSIFFPAKIKSLNTNTLDSIVLEIDCGNKSWTFKSGQYLSLKANINNEIVYRNYSICCSPRTFKFEFGVRVLSNGLFSSWLATCKKGQELEVSKPRGLFYLRPPQISQQENLFIAAGSGITPIISMLEDYLESYVDKNVKAILLYSNQNMARTMFLNRLMQLKNRFLNRLEIHFFTSQEKQDVIWKNIRFDQKGLELILQYGILKPENITMAYICGPLKMMDVCKDFLVKNKIKSNNIFTEYFAPTEKSVIKTKECKVNKNKRVEKSNSSNKVTVKMNGIEHSFFYNEGTLLSEAKKQGIDFPYACTGGVCGTCRAKLVEGKVNMAKNYALEKEDLKKKFILTCQAVPISKTLKINFDY